PGRGAGPGPRGPGSLAYPVARPRPQRPVGAESTPGAKESPTMNRVSVLVTSAALCVALCLAGCARSGQKPNVVLIVVDSLRADALGSYGGQSGATPNIDRLA